MSKEQERAVPKAPRSVCALLCLRAPFALCLSVLGGFWWLFSVIRCSACCWKYVSLCFRVLPEEPIFVPIPLLNSFECKLLVLKYHRLIFYGVFLCTI
jgi:hypothetical protein